MATPTKQLSGQYSRKLLFYALFIIFIPVVSAFALKHHPQNLLSTRGTQTLSNPSISNFSSTKRYISNADQSSNIAVANANNNSIKYHLIWSQNFWKKTVVSTIIILLVDKRIPLYFAKPCHQTRITAVALPLLSSSCCAIQLLINALSGWGCAGFNSILGPVRPILLSLLLFSTWKLSSKRPIGWTILSLFLAFLPELVHIFNLIKTNQWKKRQISFQNNDVVTAKLQLQIPGMGCVACVNKIDASIRQCKSATRIVQEKSWLNAPEMGKGGMAELIISASSDEEVDGIVKSVISAIREAGFECQKKSLQIS
jgi:copper chaperone CopZ